MATTAFSVVLNELEERRETIAQALISGAAKDFAEYKYMTGEIQGLSRAHDFITKTRRFCLRRKPKRRGKCLIRPRTTSCACFRRSTTSTKAVW